jgi:hypothetical protein
VSLEEFLKEAYFSATGWGFPVAQDVTLRFDFTDILFKNQ